jgi:hypothetical protein
MPTLQAMEEEEDPSEAEPLQVSRQTLPMQQASQMQVPPDPRLQFEERPIMAGKRKEFATPRRGTGAGNHEPYEGEPGYGAVAEDEPPTMAQQYENGYIDPDDLTDEELADLLAQARESAERRGLFNVRRTQGKMARPSHATMFLDMSYQTAAAHPSQLRNSSAGAGHSHAGEASKNLIWM